MQQQDFGQWDDDHLIKCWDEALNEYNTHYSLESLECLNGNDAKGEWTPLIAVAADNTAANPHKAKKRKLKAVKPKDKKTYSPEVYIPLERPSILVQGNENLENHNKVGYEYEEGELDQDEDIKGEVSQEGQEGQIFKALLGSCRGCGGEATTGAVESSESTLLTAMMDFYKKGFETGTKQLPLEGRREEELAGSNDLEKAWYNAGFHTGLAGGSKS